MKQEKLTKEQKIEIAQKHFNKFAKIKTDIDGQLELFVLVMYDILNEIEDYYLEKLNTDKKESPLDRPSAYHLIDIFKELKFGRPAASQKYLQKCIEQLEALEKIKEKNV